MFYITNSARRRLAGIVIIHTRGVDTLDADHRPHPVLDRRVDAVEVSFGPLSVLALDRSHEESGGRSRPGPIGIGRSPEVRCGSGVLHRTVPGRTGDPAITVPGSG